MDDVRKPSSAYDAMLQRWELPRDLLGGTEVMREQSARGKWMVKEPKETKPAYQARVSRSILFNGFGDTVESLSDRPFARELTVDGGLSPQLAAIQDNADQAGQTLHQMAAVSFQDAVAFGKTHYLIDLPKLTGSENRAQVSGVSPSIVHVPALDLIGWQSLSIPGQGEVLTQIRILEKRTEPDGEFGDREVEYVRVFDAPADGQAGRWRIYRQSAKGEFEPHDEGTHGYPGVPLVTFYTRRTGFMRARSPLEDLAWVNLRHWQSFSDQSNILRFARVAQMAVSGYTEKDNDEHPIEGMGWNQLILLEDTDAKAYMVEHSGEAITAGEEDLRRLEERMEILGMQPLIERVSDSTATGVRAQQGKTMTRIQKWIRDCEIALTNAYAVAARLVGQELPEDFKLDIFSDFSAPGRSEDADSLLKARMSGDLSREQFLREWKRRDILESDMDVEEEMGRIEEEGPSPGLLGIGEIDPDEPDEPDEPEAE